MGGVLRPDAASIELIARRIHEQYVHDHRDDQDTRHAAARPWDDLTEELREQNRSQARDNVDKLAEIGYRLVAVGHLGDSLPLQLTEADVEELARREHDRWARLKQQQGYRYGTDRSDTPPELTHPDLVGWDELDERTKDKDRRPVRRMAEVLDTAGFALARLDRSS